ncbi:MAG: HEAT repeat domain-containing protein [Zavarzinella sp.]
MQTHALVNDRKPLFEPIASTMAFVPACSLIVLSFLHPHAIVVLAGIAGVLMGIAGAIFVASRYRRISSWIYLGVFAIAYFTCWYFQPSGAAKWVHLVQAILLIIPFILILDREFTSRNGAARKAKFLLWELSQKTDWPKQLTDIVHLPEATLLRQYLRRDPLPGINALIHVDLPLQVLILLALEDHPSIEKAGVDRLILHVNSSTSPEVKAAGMNALARVHKTRHLQAILPFLRDQSKLVRRAALQALMLQADQRWTVIRGGIRDHFGFPRAERDGHLPYSEKLPPEATEDLILWMREGGIIEKRATKSFIRHCDKILQEDTSMAIERVVGYLLNPKIPTPIRVELAHKLKKLDWFPIELASKFIGKDQPTMLRLIAAETLLAHKEDPRAIAILEEAAVQPNREIQMAAAVMVQKYCCIDLGLPVTGVVPDPNTHEATKIFRELHRWSTELAASRKKKQSEVVPIAKPLNTHQELPSHTAFAESVD